MANSSKKDILSTLSDQDLCSLAQNGNRIAEEELIHRYLWLVRFCARPYFLAGGDGEDLIQEAMVGFMSAIREFDCEKNSSFTSFSKLCINRKIFTAIKSATAAKHSPLNAYISINTPLFDSKSIISFANPETLVIGKEESEEIISRLSGVLSAFEKKVLVLYLDGLSYSEISQRLNKAVKSVDNAIQRIRRKTAEIYTRREQA